MAADKVIAAELKLNTGNSNAEIKEVNKNLADTKTALSDVDKQAKKTGSEIQSAGGNFSKLKDQLTAIPGPVGQATQGVTGLSQAFKVLLANPVGLVLAALVATVTLLYKAFTNTFEGGQKVERVFAGIKAAGQALLDNLDKIGNAIVKVFSFDFSGAVDELNGVVEAATDAYNTTAKLTKELQEIRMRDLEGDVDDARRKARLSALKEEMQSEEVSFKRKKEIALELKKEAEFERDEGIKDDRRRIEIQIELLKLQKDGAKKNAEEISALQVELLNEENEKTQEVIRINKQLNAIEKQEAADRKERAAKAAEEEKQRLANLVEFQTKLRKLQQDNALAQITDSTEKELKAIEYRYEEEKRLNQQALKDKKINAEQLAQLQVALDLQLQLQRDAIEKKRQEEVKKKEEDFHKELAKLSSETVLKGIVDARELERVQLQIGYEERLADAMARYKDDQEKFFAVKQQIDEQFRLEQEKIDEKNRVEDGKKKLANAEGASDAILNDPKATYDMRKAALDAELLAVQEAYDQKIIAEEDYNKKVSDLSKQREDIRNQEQQHNAMIVSAIGDGLETLANIAGKQTAAGKALAVASSTIKTIQGGIAAFTGFVSQIPGPVGIALGAVAAAGVVASGIANVKKILSVKVPGATDSVSSPDAGIAAPTAPIAPQQQSTRIDEAQIEALKKSQQEQQTMRAYVVDRDVRDANGRNERLERAATLGG